MVEIAGEDNAAWYLVDMVMSSTSADRRLGCETPEPTMGHTPGTL